MVEGVQPAPGPVGVRGGVEVPQLLAGDVGGGDLPAGVTDVQSGEQPAVGVRAQMLGPALPHPADAVERIAGAPPVPAGVLLHPAADVVDRLLGQANGVEGVQHDGRTRQGRAQGAFIAAEGIQRRGGDPGAPAR